MEERTLRSMVSHVQAIDLAAHIRSQQPADKFATDQLNIDADGIATIPLAGTLMKFVSSLDDGTSTVLARRLVRAAVADSRVRGIMLRIDSPGGTVAGTNDLAEEVATAAARKPVHAFIEDQGASAAFWIASQAARIATTRTSVVGSIGTLFVIADVSAMAEKRGIKVHVISTGDMKGAGVEGTPITAEQLAMWQALVDQLNEHFLAGVASGRRMSMKRVRELADGRVHVGADAMALGLVDAVTTLDDAFETLRKAIAKNERVARRSGPAVILMESQHMDGKQNVDAAAPKVAADTGPKPATIAELKAAMPGAGSDFLLACLSDELTLATAKDKWLAKVSADLAAKEKRIAELEKDKSAKTTAAAAGVEPVKTQAAEPTLATSGDPIERWDAAVAEQIKAGRSKQDAARAVAVGEPELRRAYVEAYTANARANGYGRQVTR